MSYDSVEFLSIYPEWQDAYAKVEQSYIAFVSEVERVYARLRQLTDRAQFAREAKKYFFYGVLLAWKSEEEDRKHQWKEGASREGVQEWHGIDGWAYYGAWSVKRLTKDMRELAESGGVQDGTRRHKPTAPKQ